MARTYMQKKDNDSVPHAGKALSREVSKNPGVPMETARSMLMNKAMADRGHRIDLPDAMREKMEAAFGMNFGKVNLYESEKVADAGANAIAQGGNIAFAPGKDDFNSLDGQRRLGHELSHIASQARGEVAGSGFLKNGALEARADREGALAASGEQVYGGPVMDAPSFAGASAPMQADDDEKKKNNFEKLADMADYIPDEDYLKGIGLNTKEMSKQSEAFQNSMENVSKAKNLANVMKAPGEISEGVGNTVDTYKKGDTVGAIQQGMSTGAGALDAIKSGAELMGAENTDFLETGGKILNVGSNALGAAANANRAKELDAMVEKMDASLRAKFEKGEKISQRDKVMLAIARQAARNANVQAWSSGVKAGTGATGFVGKAPGVGTVTNFVTGTANDVVEGELKKSLVTDTLNDDFDFDENVRENQGSRFFKQAKHNILAEQGFKTGKRKEAFLVNSLERANLLKSAGDEGTEDVVKLLDAMGVQKGENGYDTQLIGQRLGMEEGTQEEIDKYRATHKPSNKFVADTSFHRGIKHATNNAEKVLNGVTFGAGGWLAKKLEFLKKGRQKNISKKMKSIEGK